MERNSPELKAAYEELEGIIRRIVKLETAADEEMPAEAREGVVIDMFVVYAMAFLNGDGESADMIGWVSPADGDITRYKLLGLMDYCQTMIRGTIGSE